MNARLRQASPSDADSLALIAELDAELAVGTPREHMHGLRPGEESDPRLRFFVLEVDGVVAGCGALRELEPGVAELKRMFVRPAFRGGGFGRVVLAFLEREATAAGIHTLRLETAEFLEAAVGLYRSAGFARIQAYGEYIGSPISYCMEKQLQ